MSDVAGVSVRTYGSALGAIGKGVQSALVRDKVPSALAARDPTLWGPEVEAEAAHRLGWLDLPHSSVELLPQLARLRERARDAGLDHVVLAGMGGSSLAAEVITRTEGVELTVLDTTDPHQVRGALEDRLDRTLVVVASKSGGTVETDSHRRAYEQAFRDAGLSGEQLAARFVVVTDPGSPLEDTARAAGNEVVLADPSVGGRYSALSAFGLVPSALAGADVEQLLASARELATVLGDEEGNPGLELGALLGGGGVAGHDKVVLADAGSGIVGFGDWVEQLVAESTGKDAKGLLPVVVEGLDAPGMVDEEDTHCVVVGSPPERFAGTVVSGPLGAQFLLWEYATAVAGRILGINPFDQPNVQESKDITGGLLEGGGGAEGDAVLPEGTPAVQDGAVAVYADAATLRGATDLPGVLAALCAAVDARGYLAVMAYLDRFGQAEAARLRPLLAGRLTGERGTRQVTFGWGPRFLHSTGQYHKGGPQTGAFLQVTGAVERDLPVPGRPYTFGRLQLAQALGDLGALSRRGRPVVRLHLHDREQGLRQLLDAAGTAG